jgi:hypothetical protein
MRRWGGEDNSDTFFFTNDGRVNRQPSSDNTPSLKVVHF